ncbi:MAG: hypothetical protein ACREMO_10565, partial [Gemmatimonadales bacterium]
MTPLSVRRLFVLCLALLAYAFSAAVGTAQVPLPPLPDSTGWGVHVLAVARDPRGSIWVGTYGQGIFRLRPRTTAWQRLAHDSSTSSIS